MSCGWLNVEMCLNILSICFKRYKYAQCFRIEVLTPSTEVSLDNMHFPSLNVVCTSPFINYLPVAKQTGSYYLVYLINLCDTDEI